MSKKIVIVGGVAGGASAAARARRLSEDAEVVVFERGPHISFANCGLPYHIGGEITDRDRLLVQTPQSMRSRFNLDIRINSEVKAIDRKNREIVVQEATSGREYRESYDKLILSPGAEAVHPPIPGSDLDGVLTLRNMGDMDRIMQWMSAKNAQRALVVGGGFIGLEMAEAFRYRGLQVALVELAPQVMGPLDPEMASLLHQELKLNQIDLKLETAVTEIIAKERGFEVMLSVGDSLLTDMVILAIGVKPETKLARETDIDLGETGGIAVNEHMQTSDPDIYAVGDAVEVVDFVTGKATLIPLAGPANRQGRIAADHIFGRDSKYGKTQGTSICKVFGLAAGSTGASEKSLKKAGLTYEKVFVHSASHAGYYPGAVPISLKLLFDPTDGKILGSQAVAADGVDKRMDVLAMAIRAGMTVYDLEEAELSYAPPFGSAKDVVNYAGFVAANVLKKDVEICHSENLADPGPSQILLDVRTPDEVEAGSVPGALNIPVDQLRQRIHELPMDKEILVFCQVGLRGYVACRILKQKGYKCRNLTGGYKTWTLCEQGGRLADPKPTEVKNDSGDSSQDTRNDRVKIVKQVNACGLQCPGPILSLKKSLDEIEVGEALTIESSDPGFATDVPAWCRSTGHDLISQEAEKGKYTATIKKKDVVRNPVLPVSGGKKMSIVVFSGDFDKAVAAFIIANGAA